MASILGLALVLIVVAAGGSVGLAGAQSPPPNSSPSSCTASLMSLAPCVAYLQGGPNNISPTPGCCTALASVVNTSAACLCLLLTTTNNPLGIPINQTQALALPGSCQITTPPLSQCKSSAVSSPPAAAPSSPTPVVSPPAAAPSSPTPVVSPPAAAPSSPSPVVSPTPTAKSPATSAAVPPATTATSGGSHEGPTGNANGGSMMGVNMLIHVVGMMGSLTYIISASRI